MINTKAYKSEIKKMSHHREEGFTLIELSIVLVIIGLIVGGILVGQDMIKAAQIRATVAQLEKYNAAVNTFRSKYNGLPGDLLNPTNFFPGVTGSAGTTGLANGNGLIEGSGTDVMGLDGENAVFWYELFQANMIPDNNTNLGLATAAYTISPTVLPPAKIGKATYFHVASSGGLNYFVLAGFSGTTTAASGDFATIGLNLSPNEAFQIDTKMDDGIPTTGTVVSAGGANAAAVTTTIVTQGGTYHATGALAAGDCYDSTLSIYATSAAATKDAPGCVLRIRTNF
ncbi:MAG: prepilin-type N-terminal cleavage/methylation domain-containing protein [Alphaproteobacteria bacterium]|nr:prepilin-type N-terminal cleavage/methylation domain-containing protein [Alphaproteobacteria bacterium]